MHIIKPETVIRSHQQGFKLFWRWKSRHKSGRPQIPQEEINLIEQMASDNPLWGAPRIQGELQTFEFDITESTELRYVPKKPRRTAGQQRKTLPRNHSTDIISLDFFTVPTINSRLLYVLVFLSHCRGKIIHFNVTDHPTSEWAAQQLRNAFSDEGPLKFLIRDREGIVASPLPCGKDKCFESRFRILPKKVVAVSPSHPTSSAFCSLP